MDMRFEAAPMEAGIEMVSASISAQTVEAPKAIVRLAQVVSISCPSIAGTSISAVAPDHIFEGGTALAAA